MKHKTRVVVQGFSKHPGVDFEQPFAPVTYHATLRMYLTVVAKRGLVVQHFDVKTAYLNGSLEKEVYIRQLIGYGSKVKEECSTYGLRQSTRCRNRKLKKNPDEVRNQAYRISLLRL